MAAFSSPLLLLLLLLLLRRLVSSGAATVSTEFLYPNFTASTLHLISTAGVFLAAPGAAFSATFLNPGGQQQTRYYLAVLHSPSDTIVWSANPSAPVPSSSVLSFSPAGLSLSFPNSSLAWSTPPLPRPAAALRLLDSGELLLLDASNASLWSSFNHPTDSLLPGQPLPAGAALSSSTSNSDLSPGDYRLLVTPSDAFLQWTKSSQFYWSFSTDSRSVKDSNAEVAYVAINATGLDLFANGSGGPRTVFEVTFPPPSFADELRFAKLDSSGRLRVLSYAPNRSSSMLATDFVAPTSSCELPFTCKVLGLCITNSNYSTCTCPSSFVSSPGGGCSPADGSVLSSCSSSSSGSGLPPGSYLSLGTKIGYLATKFATPVSSGKEISACQDLCSGNCSCLGFFYKNSSKSCYLLKDQLGSLVRTTGDSTDTSVAVGYIKTLKSSPSTRTDPKSSTHFLPILLPSLAIALLLVLLFFIGFRRWKRKTNRTVERTRRGTRRGMKLNLGAATTPSDEEERPDKDDDDDIWIPGLPTRFTYADLEAATDGFRTRIGSGGFGAVYKGQLPDKTLVAVKKINNIGVQGKREFCTEIAVIGNIHHVNLVRLRGFCAQGSRRLLVYEYMNRSSLDRSLFGPGPVLEWQERLDIAIGAARGLAYLHSGCERRIVHCDVKPENILLHDRNQVKISDFGLAKLMSPEQSGLFTTMRGTRGYLAPEWLTNSAISDRTDVYSFGMVLLEIIRGRKNRSEESWPGSSGSSGSSGVAAGRCDYFPMVALERHERGRYEELADPRLDGRVSGPEIARMVKVALCCLHEEPGLRPSMSAVVGMLEGVVPLWEPRVELLRFLRVYGRGFLKEGSMGSGGNHTGSVASGATTTSGSSPPPASYYMSSQQLSGPR
ncbi:G-type lectin S-receptor-like serine/threonine-protein kinase At5g35370 [Phoenix dactylifera]|uniref:Receptor-like serine/threonine-protein kinase n=1 Tax=Phoenix dactylifera TaxID=42345 RepID=A0A8B7CWY6_PHODC|nr:G-type lectin S-receptor-like serine/threonine-protein kinase At5g35370 [Phoenix dactylifera]